MNMMNLMLSLPVTDHTWIFFLVLIIILFAPILFAKIRVPHIIGMIIAGILIGEYGFNILERDSSFELFGQVGIYYIMFLAGLEMDLVGLKKNKGKSFFFGSITFLIPLVITLLVCYFVLNYHFMTSLLISSLFGSQTLVSYTIVGRYGQSKHKSVVLSIGATIIASFVSLLSLAFISAYYEEGTGFMDWVLLLGKMVFYFLAVAWTFPIITRWFFRRYEDNVMQYIFVLSLVFLSAAAAELAGIEGILGAFFAGIVLNRMIPKVSPLMNRIEFVGNALFIPYFLIGVGMIINVGVLFEGLETLKIMSLLVVLALVTKWIPAWITQKLFHMNKASRQMMFGLTSAHAAGAIAMVLVGTKIEISPGVFLVNDEVLNSIIMVILASCIASSIATEKAAKSLALEENSNSGSSMINPSEEKILITYANPHTVELLTNIGLMIHNHKSDKEMIGLSVVFENDEDAAQKHSQSKKNLEKAVKIAASVDVKMHALSRVSTNIASGIVHTMKEHDVSDLILGLHHKSSIVDTFLGTITDNILPSIRRQIMIVKCLMPVNTHRRIVVAIPPKSEYEPGFFKCIERISRIGEQLGCIVHFFSSSDALSVIKNYVSARHKSLQPEYAILDSWDDFILLSEEVSDDYLLVVVSARRGSISYDKSFEILPLQLNKYFNNNSLMIIYPDQYAEDEDFTSFTDPRSLTTDTRGVDIVRKWVYNWNQKK